MTMAFAGDPFWWTGSTLYYLLAEALGSTTVAAAAATSRHSRQVYGPWGEVRGETGALPTRYQFTGQRRDEPGWPVDCG